MTSEEEIVSKAKQRFIEELPSQLEALRAELSRFATGVVEAHNSICSILHQIKGAAGFFGFEDVVSEIRSFEHLYKDCTSLDVLKERERLIPIFNILKAIIQTDGESSAR
jgi:chemotaxis protein histidine kinase CheA